jgi:hypothetical protein
MDIGHMLADYLRETTPWREKKFEEHPDDARNGAGIPRTAELPARQHEGVRDADL